MGPCGTEGTFSRAAEETTIVLRENASALLTILSAVVADPLYKWNLTPRQARNKQRGEDDEGSEAEQVAVEQEKKVANQESEQNSAATNDQANDAAVRALARIQEKLQGFENGMSGERQSVGGQVQLLINSARDEDNLCRLFYGWYPYI